MSPYQSLLATKPGKFLLNVQVLAVLRRLEMPVVVEAADELEEIGLKRREDTD